ncbi:Uncharacterised protein [Mycobacterium tuberculosis]|nr:Uncharacterised protein [Mycobacterium tuberculosis]
MAASEAPALPAASVATAGKVGSPTSSLGALPKVAAVASAATGIPEPLAAWVVPVGLVVAPAARAVTRGGLVMGALAAWVV